MRLAGSLVMAALVVAFTIACKGDPTGGSVDGRQVYASVCASCHGPHGKPPAAMIARLGVKDLTDPTVRQQLTAARVEQQVRAGSANKLMPSFAGGLTDAQIAAVAAFVVGPELTP